MTVAATVEIHDIKALPVVISGPGEYRTRDGRRVTIHAVSGNATFCAKGSVWREFLGKVRPRGYDIWHPSGRAFLFREANMDIVAPYDGAS